MDFAAISIRSVFFVLSTRRSFRMHFGLFSGYCASVRSCSGNVLVNRFCTPSLQDLRRLDVQLLLVRDVLALRREVRRVDLRRGLGRVQEVVSPISGSDPPAKHRPKPRHQNKEGGRPHNHVRLRLHHSETAASLELLLTVQIEPSPTPACPDKDHSF